MRENWGYKRSSGEANRRLVDSVATVHSLVLALKDEVESRRVFRQAKCGSRPADIQNMGDLQTWQFRQNFFQVLGIRQGFLAPSAHGLEVGFVEIIASNVWVQDEHFGGGRFAVQVLDAVEKWRLPAQACSFESPGHRGMHIGGAARNDHNQAVRNRKGHGDSGE